MAHIAMLKNTSKRTFLLFLMTIVATLFFTATAHSVMPAEVYAGQAKNSKIKAIAIVKDVEVMSVGKHYSDRQVTFTLEYANSSTTPKTFTGLCKSVDTPSQENNMLAGGNIYYYPKEKERVYVTISEDGGSITSMTNITPALEDAFRNDPNLISYRFGKASAQGKAAPPIPIPVLRGKEPALEDQIPTLDALEIPGKEQGLAHQSQGHGNLEAVHPPPQSANDIQGQFIMAVGSDQLQEVTRFIELGANINKANDKTGQTPLMMVESKAMADLLIKYGADAKAKDSAGWSVLHYAVTRDNATELIQYFVPLGADPGLKGWDGESALFIACQYFHESRAFDAPFTLPGQPPEITRSTDPRITLKTLVNAGADINVRDDIGNTLLMNVVAWDNNELASLLLELGADKNLDNDGRTARDMAKSMGHRTIYQLLE